MAWLALPVFGCDRQQGEPGDGSADEPAAQDGAQDTDGTNEGMTNEGTQDDAQEDGEVCVAESPDQTCVGRECGTRTNNCGEPVRRGDCADGVTCRDGACIEPYPIELLYEDVDPFVAGETVPVSADRP